MASSRRSADGPRHLVLIGMMGAGKTTVGRKVADRLGRAFLDSDEQVSARTGRTVRQIFESDGEAAFRKLETDVLREALASPTPAVIAAAGGVVLNPENREVLRDSGADVVWLRARPEVLAGRATQRGGEHRPLLANDPVGTMRRLSEERRPLYEQVATDVVDVEHLRPPQVVRVVTDIAGADAP